ncbi:MAG: hypothetical protein ABIM89_01900 [Mycobacteriales bacterium]
MPAAASVAPPLASRWEGAVVAATIAATCGGAALVGGGPLFVIVLLIQVALALAWLALTDVPAASGGVLIIVGAAVAADVYAGSAQASDQTPVVVIVSAAFVLAVLRQLARRRRSGVTDSLSGVMTGVVAVVFASHLIAARRGPDGVAAVAAICFAVAIATGTRRTVDALIGKPALRAGAGRAWPGLVLSVAAATVVGAYVGAARTGLQTRTGAMIGLGAALAAAVADLGIGLGSLHLVDARQRSAIAPLVVLLPLVVAAPVGYGVARLLAE